MAAVFPAAISTSSNLKTAVNNLTFTLSSAISAGDTTVNVTSTTGAPSSGSFHVGTEVFYYTGKTSTTFTGVTRGQDGTSDQDHAQVSGGNEVLFGPEAHYTNDLTDEVIAIETELGVNLANVIKADGTNPLTADWDVGPYKITAEQLESDVTTGTAPLVIASTTVVSNLNADQVDGYDISDLTLNTSTDISSNSWILDQDDMSGDDNTKAATQQSIKAYVDAHSTIETSAASSATPTPARASTKTLFILTALATDPTFGEPTGTAEEGDLLWIRITDDGTGRTLAWNAAYQTKCSSSIPTSTTANKELNILFTYNDDDSKWDMIATTEES